MREACRLKGGGDEVRIRWHRLLSAPTVHVQSVDGDTTLLRVDGVVCDGVCDVRTKQALESIEGVRSVSVDYERGLATVEGAPRSEATYQRALDAVVTGASVRRLIERIARTLGARPAEEAGRDGPAAG
jgi:hypothetical protein